MFENQFLKKSHEYIFATDEVGRGPLAGPVVACAVEAKNNQFLQTFLRELQEAGVTDSKKLSEKKRKEIIQKYFGEIKDLRFDKKITLIKDEVFLVLSKMSPEEIDEVNILQASLLSMRKALLKLKSESNSVVLVDGNKTIKNLPTSLEIFPIVKGDSKSVLIALASIFAKEYRDYLMGEYAMKYPGYGLENHAGYPTKAHLDAINKLGITDIHRKTFKGVKEHVISSSN
ncbi:MAG: ribonuclease HII [Bacteriovoracaceae bacterium]|nr:ribonuclease HII [Bacteriovoracaceae bacterium]